MVGKKRVKSTTVKSSKKKNLSKNKIKKTKKKLIKHNVKSKKHTVRAKIKKNILESHKVRHERDAHKKHIAHAGINLLTGYIVTLALFYIVYFFTRMMRPQLYPGSMQGTLIIDAAMIIALLFMIKGFYTRPAWVYNLSLWWFALSIPYSIFSMYFLRAGIFEAARGLFFISFLFMLLINGIIIWYLIKKKDYLTDPKASMVIDQYDKIFIYLMVGLLVTLMFLSIVIGNQLYEDKKMLADEVINDLSVALRENDLNTARDFCMNSQGEKQDMCYLVLTNAYKGEIHFCDKIQSDMYKFLCLQSMT